MNSLEKVNNMVTTLEGGLEGEPLHGSIHMAVMAVTAKEGGAIGIRANGHEDIKAIKERVNLPVIGILKKHYQGYDAFITPTKRDAKLVAEAGADIISIDATNESRRESLEELVHYIHDTLHKQVMAYIATAEEAIYAEQIGL
jgi:N-acylglucosamine-6-phosphate 2-epimerase